MRRLGRDGEGLPQEKKLVAAVDASGRPIEHRDHFADVARLVAAKHGIASSARPRFIQEPLAGVEWRVAVRFEKAGVPEYSMAGISIYDAIAKLRRSLLEPLIARAKADIGLLALCGEFILEADANQLKPDWLGAESKPGYRSPQSKDEVVDTTGESTIEGSAMQLGPGESSEARGPGGWARGLPRTWIRHHDGSGHEQGTLCSIGLSEEDCRRDLERRRVREEE